MPRTNFYFGSGARDNQRRHAYSFMRTLPNIQTESAQATVNDHTSSLATLGETGYRPVSLWRSELPSHSGSRCFTYNTAYMAKTIDVFARFGFSKEFFSDNSPQLYYLRRRNSDRLFRANGLLTQRQARSYLARMEKSRDQYTRTNYSFVNVTRGWPC